MKHISTIIWFFRFWRIGKWKDGTRFSIVDAWQMARLRTVFGQISDLLGRR